MRRVNVHHKNNDVSARCQLADTVDYNMFRIYTVFSVALPHSFCRRCPLRIFGIIIYGRCCTTVLHRRRCK